MDDIAKINRTALLIDIEHWANERNKLAAKLSYNKDFLGGQEHMSERIYLTKEVDICSRLVKELETKLFSLERNQI